MTESEKVNWEKVVQKTPEITKQFCGLKIVLPTNPEEIDPFDEYPFFEFIPNFHGLWRHHCQDYDWGI